MYSSEQSPVILITGIIIIVFVSLPHHFLLSYEVGLLLLLCLIRRGVEVTAVVEDLGLVIRALQLRSHITQYNTHMSQPPLQHLRCELVGVAQVAKAHDLGGGLLVLDAENGGDHSDLQTVAQERALLSVNLTELCLQMLLGQEIEMFVEYFASEGLLSVEMYHTVVASFRHIEELLLLRDLRVLAVASCLPLGLLLLIFLHHV